MAIFLKTKRLILKKAKWSHLADLIALRACPDVARFISPSNGQPQPPEEVESFLKLSIEYQKKYGFGFYSVFERKSGVFIGQVGIFHLGLREDQPEMEIAYALHKKYWGKGYATELAAALIDWGFAHLPIIKLSAHTFPENIPSSRVLEKVGMRFAGRVDYEGHEVDRYEIYRNL